MEMLRTDKIRALTALQNCKDVPSQVETELQIQLDSLKQEHRSKLYIFAFPLEFGSNVECFLMFTSGHHKVYWQYSRLLYDWMCVLSKLWLPFNAIIAIIDRKCVQTARTFLRMNWIFKHHTDYFWPELLGRCSGPFSLSYLIYLLPVLKVRELFGRRMFFFFFKIVVLLVKKVSFINFFR